MLARLVRWTAWLLVVGALVWVARLALKRYVEGPPAPPTSESCSPVSADGVRAASPGGASASPPVGAGAGAPAWVEPGPDGCPPGYLVKAKRSSRLYHLPGMAAYERTRPDRCYASAEAAEADGFARAKR